MGRKRHNKEPLPESREEILAHLEQLTGRRFRTRVDVREFVAQMDVEKTGATQRSKSVWQTVKTATLLALLLLAFVQFYFTDALLQIASLRSNTFFVPVQMNDIRSTAPVNDRG